MHVDNPNPAAMALSERLRGDWYIETDGRAAFAYQADPDEVIGRDAGGHVEVTPTDTGWYAAAYDWNERRGAFDLDDGAEYQTVEDAAAAAAYFAKTLSAPGSRMSRQQYRDMSGGQRANDFDFQGWL